MKTGKPESVGQGWRGGIVSGTVFAESAYPVEVPWRYVMIRTMARILAPLLIANALFDFAFPEFGTQFFTRGPGRRWSFPGREIVENISCLTPKTRRYIAVWEALIGVLLFAMANEERFVQPMPAALGPVRVPVEHVRS
jgi:hypothetical protein